MSDRELLGQAAKAAEIPVRWVGLFLREDSKREWNPLIYDGDALRLAVKLNLEITCDDPTEHMPFAHAKLIETDLHVFEPVVACPYSATRRAIVRAAAEIRKEQP